MLSVFRTVFLPSGIDNIFSSAHLALINASNRSSCSSPLSGSFVHFRLSDPATIRAIERTRTDYDFYSANLAFTHPQNIAFYCFRTFVTVHFIRSTRKNLSTFSTRLSCSIFRHLFHHYFKIPIRNKIIIFKANGWTSFMIKFF